MSRTIRNNQHTGLGTDHAAYQRALTTLRDRYVATGVMTGAQFDAVMARVNNDASLTDYDRLVFAMLGHEQAPLFVNLNYVGNVDIDGEGYAAIGFGYDLYQNRATLIADLTAAGIVGAGDVQILEILRQLQNNQITGATAASRLNAAGFTVTYDEAVRLYAAILPRYEDRLERFAGVGIPDSVERAMLVDAQYQGIFGTYQINIYPRRNAAASAFRAGDYEEAFVILAFTDNGGGSGRPYRDNRALTRALIFGGHSLNGDQMTSTEAFKIADALLKYKADIDDKRNVLQAENKLSRLADMDREMAALITDVNVALHREGVHLVGRVDEQISDIATTQNVNLTFLQEIYGNAVAAAPFTRVLLPISDPQDLTGGAVPRLAADSSGFVAGVFNGKALLFQTAAASPGQLRLVDQTGLTVGTVAISNENNVWVSSGAQAGQVNVDLNHQLSISYRVIPDDGQNFARRVEVVVEQDGQSRTYTGETQFKVHADRRLEITEVSTGVSSTITSDALLAWSELLQFNPSRGMASIGEVSGGVSVEELMARVIDPDGKVVQRHIYNPDGSRIDEASYFLNDGHEGTAGDYVTSRVFWASASGSAVYPKWVEVKRAGHGSVVTATYYSTPGQPFNMLTINPVLNIEYPDAAITGEQIGSIFGSILGNRIAGDNVATRIVASALLSTVAGNIGEIIDNFWRDPEGLVPGQHFTASQKFNEAVQDLPVELKQSLTSAGAGAISSILTAEIFSALDIEGELAVVGQDVANAYLTQIITNIATSGVEHAFDGLQNINPLTIIASYFGAKLASQVVELETVSGQIGAQLGTAIGAAAGAKIGATYGSAGGPIGALVGAFLGYIFGGLLGDSLGSKPKSGAEVVWDGTHQRFSVGSVWSKHKGSKAGATHLAASAASILNSLIDVSGARVANGYIPGLGSYGTSGKDYVYRDNGRITFKTQDAAALIDYGSYYAVKGVLNHLAGGDIYVKRAITAAIDHSDGKLDGIAQDGSHFSTDALFGDVAIGQDYARYLQIKDQVDQLIAAQPESAFSAGWILTFARVQELGLNKRNASDWIGGWAVFLDEAIDGAVDGAAASPTNLIAYVDYAEKSRVWLFVDSQGNVLGEVPDTILSADKEAIVGTSGADAIVVQGGVIADAATLQIDGVIVPGSHEIGVAALIDGAGGDDFIRAGNLGNDVLGGEGNDTLIGGSLDDWLFGGDGNDVLFSGDVTNAGFLENDQAAENLAITVSGGNGNYLDGGSGNDRLYGGNGSDWIRGGEGVDRLVGGAGGDILEAGADDDRGANGEAAIFGGAGSDQYIFGFGDGKDVIFDEASPGYARGTTDSIDTRYGQIRAGTLTRNWTGDGEYEVDGTVKGGEDAIAFGIGISASNIQLRRSGNDLVISLMVLDSTGAAVLTGDELTVQDWFLSGRRVEWLRFADGEEFRIGDMTSFMIGNGESDVILGSYAADFIYGGGGDDVIRALAGDDFVNGGGGNDFVAGDGDNDWVLGGSGNDQVLGGSGHDTLFGDDGDDLVYGGLGSTSGSDLIAGGRGNDTVVGGAGDDVFRYLRGDGRDELLDDFVNNWDLVWQNGSYINGYVLQADGTVTKNGVVYFDSSKWLGQYDWNHESQTLQRHMGAVNGNVASNAGTDTLEFGIGIDIQDVQLRRNGNDLQLAIGDENSVSSFGAISDQIAIKDWFTVGNSIENFVFAATGRHAVSAMTLNGGSEGDDTLAGTAGADWLTGNGGDDVVDGSGGDDILAGNAGSDTLKGGAGADVLYGGADDDMLDGGAGADFLFGGDGMDVASYVASASGLHAYLEPGNAVANSGDARGDSLIDIESLQGAAAGGNHLGGDNAENVLIATKDDVLYGGGGEDIYQLGSGDTGVRISEGNYAIEEVLSSSGSLNTDLYAADWELLEVIYDAELGRPTDYIYKLTITRKADGSVIYFDNAVESTTQSPPIPPFSSWIQQNIDPELLATSNGGQVIREVIGSDDGAIDQLLLEAGVSLSDFTIARTSTGLSVVGSSFSVDIDGGSAKVESLQLTDGLSVDLRNLVLVGEGATANGDLMFGAGAAETLDGLAGDDVLSGLAGNDTLHGGDGNDTLEGGVGADTLDGGTDSVSLGLLPEPGQPYGDTIRYVTSDAAVNVDLAASTASGGHAAGDVLVKDANGISTIENVTGSDGFGDALYGDNRANRLIGLGGFDTLEGRGGDDVLVGGAGEDALYGGDGADALSGDDGIDRLEGGLGNDFLSGGADNDTLLGDAGDDQLTGDEGNDTLYGGTGKDTLGGWDGNDTLYGEADDDRLAGGSGDDTLDGGDGNDILAGESGGDQLHGGVGDDVYVFDSNSGADTVLDVSGLKNEIIITDADASRIWFARSGDDLVISVIGGDTAITLDNFLLVDATATQMFKITTTSGALFFGAATPLFDAMQQASATMPASMPQTVVDLLDTYWHVSGKAVPIVTGQALATDEDVAISGQVAAIDHDSNITGYSVASQPTLGTLTLDATTGAWTYTPGANQNGTDQFVLAVTDADGNQVQQSVGITIAPVNDAPTVVPPATLAVDEGTATGTLIGAFTHQDPDGPQETATFQLMDNASGRFAITADGQLTVANGGEALNYEAASSHTITVRATDAYGAWSDQTFTVTINNVNEMPYIITPVGDNTPLVVPENATGGTVSPAWTVGDPDNTKPTLQITDNPGNLLEVSDATVRVKSGVAVNFEALAAGATLEDTDGDGIKEVRLSATVIATDGQLSSAPTQFTFLVEDVNEAPADITFTPLLSSIDERDHPMQGASLPTIKLGTLAGTDPDAGVNSLDFATLTYSVSDSRFEIVNGNELYLKANAALDFEAGSAVSVDVTVTDRGGSAAGLSHTKTLTFTVNNQDDYWYGTGSNDMQTGQANRDIMDGGAGNDTLSGGNGDDDLYGQDGIDILNGQAGNDRVWGGLGDDALDGGSGDDSLYGEDGVDHLLGGDGNDMLDGGQYDDLLEGGIGNDTLDGGLGNDELRGGVGDDYLKGGDGDDLLVGDGGADHFLGGDGDDTVTYASATAGITLNLAAGATGGAALNNVFEDHIEHLIGSAYADTITGSGLADHIIGGAGNDTIYGGFGNDVLEGGDGDDVIDAQAGNDQLIGGKGNDTLIGGDDSDIYIVDLDSGADTIQNYDPNGTDIDAIGYQGITRDRLWFARSGDDLVISVVGTTVQTTVKDWYLSATASDRANYKIDFIIAGEHYSDTINAEGLVTLMAGYTKPATQAAYNTLHADYVFENQWKQHWDANGAPVIQAIGTQTINEDGTLTLQFTVADDITPVDFLTVTATAANGQVNVPTVSGPVNGVYTLTVQGAPNRSGSVDITLRARDPGGLESTSTFTLNINPSADAPSLTVPTFGGNTTLDSGSLALNIQSALVDADGSETLEIRISNIPTGLSLNQGTNLGNGVWSLTQAQLAGLLLTGPSNWSQDLTGSAALTVTAISKETESGQTAQTVKTLSIPINARPTDIAAGTLAVNESTASAAIATGTVVGQFSHTDPDGVTGANYSLTNDAGGRFQINASTGQLTVNNGSLLDREAAASHTITVRVTDAGGLTRDENFTVTINNVNEAPTIPAVSTQPITTAAENTALAGQVVANLSATDPDGTTPTFVITSDTRSWFEIVGSQLKFRSGLSFDFEALKAAGMTLSDADADGKQEVVYTAVVKASDGALDSPSTRSITVRIEDANDAPSDISSGTLSTAENAANGTLVGTFGATDQDPSSTLTFSLVNNAGGRFAINATNGQLTVANGSLLNYESATSHAITVRVSDGVATRDENFTVTVTNVNEAPSTPTITTQPVTTSTEGTALANVVAATFSATDPDGTTPTYSIASDPKGWFTMSGNQLKFNSTFNSNFETLLAAGGVTLTDVDGDGQQEVAYTASVRSNDGTLNSASTNVTVRIEDVNESPTITSTSFSIPESSPGAGQTLIGTVAVTDPDTQSYNRDFRYSLTGGDTSRFSINATTGQLYLQGTVDYETATSHQVQVTVKDRAGSGFTTSKTLTINVTDVNSAPVGSTATLGVAASSTGTSIPFSDPDGDPLSVSVLSKYVDGYFPGTSSQLDNISVTISGSSIYIQNIPRFSGYDYDLRIKLEARDPAGLTAIGYLAIRVYRGGAPITLDLDNDGLEFISLQASDVYFDIDDDGVLDRTGWVGSGDGFLALDRNGDGRITSGSEISFMSDKPGAMSDLEGLAAYDSNNNGLFDLGDDRFGDFRVWRDLNQDGLSQNNELTKLATGGITSIDLHGSRTDISDSDYSENVLYATSTFSRRNQTAGLVGDVFLAYVSGASSSDISNENASSSNLELTNSYQRAFAKNFLAETEGGVWSVQNNSSRVSTIKGIFADPGTGDVSPGKVDRRANLDRPETAKNTERLEDGYEAYQFDAPNESISSSPLPTSRTEGPSLASMRPAVTQPLAETVKDAEQVYEPEIGANPQSALHDGLALSQKKRFQMIEAMATFSAEPFTELERRRDPKVVELLTSLPDYRISA